jgi:hypothetical protein
MAAHATIAVLLDVAGPTRSKDHSSEFAITRLVVPIRHGPAWTWG